MTLRMNATTVTPDTNASGRGDDCGERFLVWIVPVRSEKNELLESCCFPCIEKVVERPVQCFLPDRCVANETSLGIDIDAVLHGRCPQHAIFC